ncbi:MAG: rSAM/selenodomain-associated transferase 2 [Parasphingorhabdus sp.]
MAEQSDVRLSIVVPVLNEVNRLSGIIKTICERRDVLDLVVVDASRDKLSFDYFSSDGLSLLTDYAEKLQIVTALDTGRASQMNLGANCCNGNVLLFLHADTQLSDVNLSVVLKPVVQDSSWGRFDVKMHPTSRLLRLIARMMNVRSRLTGIATGDQAIFVSRSAWQKVGGFVNLSLMEDIDICRRLKRLTRPLCLRQKVTTSSRRWLHVGIMKTILTMWTLRLLFWSGVSTETLSQWYRNVR